MPADAVSRPARLLGHRAHAGLALSARQRQGQLHLRHRHLFLHRRDARRRDLDHRHVGDERLPQGARIASFSASTAMCFVQPIETPLTDYKDVVERLLKVPGVRLRQRLHRRPGARLLAGRLVGRARARHAGADLEKVPGVAEQHPRRRARGFRRAADVVIGTRLAKQLGLSVGDKVTSDPAARLGDADGRRAAPEVLSRSSPRFEIGMSDARFIFRLHPLRAGRQISSTSMARRASSRCSSTIPTASTRCARSSKRPPAGRCCSPIGARRNRTFFSALEVERNVMFLILMLIVARRGAQHRLRHDHAGEGQGLAPSPSCAPWARRKARSCASSSSPGARSAWWARSRASCSGS